MGQRLKFAKKYKNWTIDDWRQVIWTDKFSFEIESSSNKKAQLQYISAQLFLKDALTAEEAFLLELSLSSIINHVHPSFKKFYNDTSLQCDGANYELQGGLTTEEVVLFDEIANTKDIDGANA
ncbi:hypothetical protein DFQ29_008788, partial [Apophysomyces sp. BC1021]